jgi:hypothetical protein
LVSAVAVDVRRATSAPQCHRGWRFDTFPVEERHFVEIDCSAALYSMIAGFDLFVGIRVFVGN